MTFRERLADWITGGALTRARLLGAEISAQRESWRDMAYMCAERLSGNRERFEAIAAMETPTANATVRRMAKVAREAME